jgi:outer membrane protein assembly factor BamA
MLGDHQLVTMGQVNGRNQDFAALVAYGNRKSRLNWIVGAQQIPYITGVVDGYDSTSTLSVAQIHRYKQTNRELSGIVAYPFNRSRRVELSAGLQQISFSHDVQNIVYDRFTGAVLDEFDQEIDDAPGALTLATGSAALVHDNSFFGATGPILGDRWRLEVDPTLGTLQFFTAIADYRRYIMPVRPFTIAGRILHVGRYGRNADDSRLYPLFMGYPSLVRGYDIGSFDVTSECESSTTCTVFDQLVGTKLLVGNVELRFPPFGLLGLGSGYYGVLPVDAGIFYDAGVAWTSTEGAQIFGNGPRKLVRSAGVSFRMNLFGYAIGQMDIVHPFDRPQKNWMVRLSLTQGF